jgi:alpha-D-ribose 1-methylphosphonate 5-triphosphate synthase subunit PhnI
MYTYTFEYRHKVTGETLKIEVEADDWREAEQMAYDQIFAICDEEGLEIVDHNENSNRHPASEQELAFDLAEDHRRESAKEAGW